MTLIEKVTSLNDIIRTQEQNYDDLAIELEDKTAFYSNLVEANEKLSQQNDCLQAEYLELAKPPVKCTIHTQTDSLVWQEWVE